MILEPFNAPHLVTIITMAAVAFFVLDLFLKKRSAETKTRVLTIICIANAIVYIFYKMAQANDPDFGFFLLANLPLHFCNLNLILLPLAIITRNKYLMAYQLYFGVVLAGLALITVDEAFRSKPLFEFTCIFYFYYHSLLAVIPLLLVKFRLFTPSFRLVWQPTLIVVALAFVMHIVNFVFRTTGLAPESNYFFTYGLRGDFFTELFWAILPYNFFFLLPSIVLFVPYIVIVTLPFHIAERTKI
jgi:uncharacterized membrane protein YwaF